MDLNHIPVIPLSKADIEAVLTIYAEASLADLIVKLEDETGLDSFDEKVVVVVN